MSLRQYATTMGQAYKGALSNAGISEYTSVCLSADRTEYEVILKDGTTRIIESGLEYIED